MESREEILERYLSRRGKQSYWSHLFRLATFFYRKQTSAEVQRMEKFLMLKTAVIVLIS